PRTFQCFYTSPLRIILPATMILSLHPVVSMIILLLEPAALRVLHSFPTRRSSDLIAYFSWSRPCRVTAEISKTRNPRDSNSAREDRKSTRLNSTHVSISYAVFCLKKKTIDHKQCTHPAH